MQAQSEVFVDVASETDAEKVGTSVVVVKGCDGGVLRCGVTDTRGIVTFIPTLGCGVLTFLGEVGGEVDERCLATWTVWTIGFVATHTPVVVVTA